VLVRYGFDFVAPHGLDVALTRAEVDRDGLAVKVAELEAAAARDRIARDALSQTFVAAPFVPHDEPLVIDEERFLAATSPPLPPTVYPAEAPRNLEHAELLAARIRAETPPMGTVAGPEDFRGDEYADPAPYALEDFPPRRRA
jgi:hypothetical protein